MSDITWTPGKRRLSELIPWPRNPRQIRGREVERLQESLVEFGQVETIAIGPDGELYNGHQRLKAWAARYGDTEVDVRVASRPLTEKEREKLTVYLHKGAAGEWDIDTLSEWDTDELLAWGFSEAELGMGFTDDEEEETEAEDGEEEELPPVPDAVWPSDNDWGIPMLDLSMQAIGLDMPVIVWGSVARTTQHRGTWNLYTSDDRYERIWRFPDQILATQCAAAIEPNFSAYSNIPPAVALWQIYRKRWVARYWQQFGVRIWADLNVAAVHADLNRMGIPQGWRAFATRGYAERINETHGEYEIARQIAGDAGPVLFLVYGGGKAVKEECKRNGWLWLPEEMDRAHNRPIAQMEADNG